MSETELVEAKMAAGADGDVASTSDEITSPANAKLAIKEVTASPTKGHFELQ